MKKQLIGLKSGSHQNLGSGIQCSQCKNTPSEGVRSKQKKLHNFSPRRDQDFDFGANDPICRKKYGCHSKIMLTHVSSGISDPT